jgi:AcrR family transcriptional regulator
MSKTDYHHGDLRNALLQEASSVLERSGARAISLRGLARAIGVSHAAPGHHFASRAALLAELAADGFAALADALEAALDAAAPDDRLRDSARAYVRFALGNPERYRLMFTGQLRHAEVPHRLTTQADRAYRQLLRTAYGSAPDADRTAYRMGAPELRAWSLVHGAVMLRLDGQIDDAIDGENFLRLVDEAVASRR